MVGNISKNLLLLEFNLYQYSTSVKINLLRRKIFTNLLHSNMTLFSPDHKDSASEGLWEKGGQIGKLSV